MCGRYTLVNQPDNLLELFDLAPVKPELLGPRYNISPGQPVLGIVADPQPRIAVLEWNFLPSWAKPGMKPVINARAESIIEGKPYFRGAYRSARCALLADGFFEWKREGNARHGEPYRIIVDGGAPFGLAGLWGARTLPDGSEQIGCAIVTTEANEVMAPIHDRMPVILDEERTKLWLDPKATPRELQKLFEPFDTERMGAYPVGTVVNNPRNDGPECIQPVEE